MSGNGSKPAFARGAAVTGSGFTVSYAQEGLTKREYAAISIAIGFCSSTPWARAEDGPEIARRSRIIADAVLAELEQSR